MDPSPAAQSWFPSLEELEEHARRRHEERGEWVFEPALLRPAPVVDGVPIASVVVVLVKE
jgi:hypothetical protein